MTQFQIAKLIDQLAVKRYGKLETGQVVVQRPADPAHGDYATNAAMVYAKQLGKSPRELANELAGLIREADSSIEHTEVAGPGFVNIRLSDEALIQAAISARDVRPDSYRGQTVLVEYSDPNPFKPLHAGHLYTTLVGDVLARFFELAGAKVIRISYGGDVGLHVAKSMWGIIRELGGEHPEKLEKVPASERPQWLGKRYVEGNAAYEDDEAARAEITEFNKLVYSLHATGDRESAFARIYWTGRQWSYEYFPHLYKQLQVEPFARVIPESEVTPLGVETVRAQLERGVYEKSDGAVVFKGEPHGLHTRVFLNSQGLPTYETKDVGLLLTKWQDYHFDRSVVITANEQEQYFAVMLKSVEQYLPEPVQRSTHLIHGMVKLAGGKKMSSRKGNVVGALDIVEAASEAARKSLKNASPETVLAAVKYAFLRVRIGGDIQYDPEESVSLEGSSGPYLQYAQARARSILSKAGSQGQSNASSGLSGGERDLVVKMGEYAVVLHRAVDELKPHYVAVYLYELAQAFNRFYEANRVIGDEREAVRLKLVETYADILKSGLLLLGITAPDRL